MEKYYLDVFVIDGKVDKSQKVAICCLCGVAAVVQPRRFPERPRENLLPCQPPLLFRGHGGATLGYNQGLHLDRHAQHHEQSDGGPSIYWWVIWLSQPPFIWD